MNARRLVASLLVASFAVTPAAAYTLRSASFSSAGGGPVGAAGLVLGNSIGLSVTGRAALAITPATLEGAGFWHWGQTLTLAVPDATPAVLAWSLSPAAPNPFSARTQIRYAIPASAGDVGVQLRIFDLAGRVVRTLDSGTRAPGSHTIAWDGRDDGGRTLGGGVYFCRVTAGTYAATRRLVLAR